VIMFSIRKLICGVAGLGLAASLATSAVAGEITIATVNNNDMIVMQKLAPKWEKATGNKINWVVLEENVLRQKNYSRYLHWRWFIRYYVYRCLRNSNLGC